MKHKPKFWSLITHVIVALIFAYLANVTWLIEVPYAWIISLNTILFISFGLDKISAIKRWRRTPESTYLILALFGAFPGLFLGRKIFNHKTSKAAFIIPMWLLFIGQILFSAWWMGDTDILIAKIAKEKQLEACEKANNCSKKQPIQ